MSFNLTEIHEVLNNLQGTEPIDISHAEMLQKQPLRGADIITEYLGKIVKTVGYLETKVNSLKNKVSLEYQATEGRTTTDMKIWAGNASPEVEEVQIKLAKAKASKIVLEKKYDLLIKMHHYVKDIATGMKRNMPNGSGSNIQVAEGW